MLFFTLFIQEEVFMRRYAAFTVCLFFIAVTPVFAEFYRWVDKEGKEYYTNDSRKVPSEYQGSVTKLTPDPSRVSIETKTSAHVRPEGTNSWNHHDKYGRGEEYWRKEATNLRSKLRDQQDAYNSILKQLEDVDQKPNVLGSEKKKSRSSLEKRKIKLEKDIAKTKRRLKVDLPEEARKADAYPGWIQE
jgi:hypothetical protein